MTDAIYKGPATPQLTLTTDQFHCLTTDRFHCQPNLHKFPFKASYHINFQKGILGEKNYYLFLASCMKMNMIGETAF